MSGLLRGFSLPLLKERASHLPQSSCNLLLAECLMQALVPGHFQGCSVPSRRARQTLTVHAGAWGAARPRQAGAGAFWCVAAGLAARHPQNSPLQLDKAG